MKWKERAARLRIDVPAVFLAMRHAGTPWYARAAAFLAVVYALSPVDLIPDFIPVLGYLDDILILPALVALAVRWIPPKVMEECRMKAEALWEKGWPKKWYFAVPVVLFWGLLLYLLIAKALRK